MPCVAYAVAICQGCIGIKNEELIHMKEKNTIDELNPGKIFETTFAFTTTRVLLSAVYIGLFTHIARGHRTVADIAKKADASERGVEIILNGLTSLDFLTKSS